MSDDEVRELTDEEFRQMFARFCAGDKEAHDWMFLYLAEKLKPMVSPVLRGQYAKVGAKAESNDVLHEVLLRMIPYLQEKDEEFFEGVGHFHRLTARVLRHTLIDLHRKHFGSMKGHSLDAASDAFASKLGQSSGMEGWRSRTSVHELIDKLDARDRKLIELALYANLRNAEVARCLGVTEGQASRLLGRAKERLGRLIVEEKQKTG